MYANVMRYGTRRRGDHGPVQLTIAYVATQFVFKFKLPSTKSVTLNWGDGTTEDVTGQDAVIITKTSAYSGAGTYSFYLSADVTDLAYIDISNQAFVSGDVSSWSTMINLTYLAVYLTGVTGDISDWSALTELNYLHCASCSLHGDISGWSAFTKIVNLYCADNSLTGDISGWSVFPLVQNISCALNSLTGDISGWSALTGLRSISAYSNSLTGDVSGFSALTLITVISLHQQVEIIGDISGWSVLTNLVTIFAQGTSVTGDVSSFSTLISMQNLWLYGCIGITGDASALSTLTAMISFACHNTSLTFDNSPAWSMTGEIRLYGINNGGATSTMVNNMLASFAGTPLTGCTILIAGTNAIRTSASDADKAIIINPVNSNTLDVNE